jgi:DNA invertase Pin-like site-specific DNA recombinase
MAYPAKGHEKRPQFDAMLKGAKRKEFDFVMAWSVDRLGRSLQHLIEFLGDVQHKADLYLHQQNIDTSTPSGKAMFQMVRVFAEFDPSLTVPRTFFQV